MTYNLATIVPEISKSIRSCIEVYASSCYGKCYGPEQYLVQRLVSDSLWPHVVLCQHCVSFTLYPAFFIGPKSLNNRDIWPVFTKNNIDLCGGPRFWKNISWIILGFWGCFWAGLFANALIRGFLIWPRTYFRQWPNRCGVCALLDFWVKNGGVLID